MILTVVTIHLFMVVFNVPFTFLTGVLMTMKEWSSSLTGIDMRKLGAN